MYLHGLKSYIEVGWVYLLVYAKIAATWSTFSQKESFNDLLLLLTFVQAHPYGLRFIWDTQCVARSW